MLRSFVKTSKPIMRSFSTAKEIEIFIDGQSHTVDSRMTIFQAAYHAGITIPRFCYHEKLSIAGNCRMCLVEVEKAPKPVAACTAQVMPGMRVNTKSEYTRNARGAVMEFLLANHPLDCPICDQGGECDLQDISINYGYETGRFQEFKRAVEDKNVGPLVSTIMTRCIHCTRCVRFAEEVAGEYDLGTVGRGQDTEIGTYIDKMINSELSGNLVDLCPVGALTNGPYAFTSRSWELLETNSIDLMEGIVSPIMVNSRGSEIMRMLPRVHENVNEEWIADKSRYSYDGLKRQRLAFPLMRNKEGQLEEVLWEDALTMIGKRLQELKAPAKELVGLVGQFSSVEATAAFKSFLNRLNSENFMYDNYPIKGTQRSDYLFNRSIPEIEEMDVLVLVGTNPKTETPVLNARILKAVRHKGLKVYKIGVSDDLTYEYTHLGTSTKTINEIIEGKHPFCDVLKSAKNAHFVIGSSLSRTTENTNQIKDSLQKYCKSVSGEGRKVTTGVLHQFVGPLSGYELGISYKSIDEVSAPKFIYNLGNDNEDLLNNLATKNKDTFVVYQGTNGDIGASYADIILPSAAWTEQDGTYVSLEGRTQLGRLVVPPPGLAKEDWHILRAISEVYGDALNFDSIEELRYRIAEICPHLLKYDFIEPYSKFNSDVSKEVEKLEEMLLLTTIDNYYKTDAISRSSVVMAKCSAAFNPTKMSNYQRNPWLK